MENKRIDRRAFLSGTILGATGATAVALTGRGHTAPAPPARPSRSRTSFAECGEDLVIYDLAHLILKLQKPTYLDIGAANPVRANNTYLMYTMHSRGVLVEPNPTFVEQERTERPEDVVLNVGIGIDGTREADYYVIRNRPELNTFSPGQAAMLRKTISDDIVERVVKMPLMPINRVIEDHFAGKGPDVLSIDVEGLDLAILRTLDFDKLRPGVICAETILGPTGTNRELGEFVVSKGYVVRGGSHVNTVFLDASRIPA